MIETLERLLHREAQFDNVGVGLYPMILLSRQVILEGRTDGNLWQAVQLKSLPGQLVGEAITAALC